MAKISNSDIEVLIGASLQADQAVAEAEAVAKQMSEAMFKRLQIKVDLKNVRQSIRALKQELNTLLESEDVKKEIKVLEQRLNDLVKRRYGVKISVDASSKESLKETKNQITELNKGKNIKIGLDQAEKVRLTSEIKKTETALTSLVGKKKDISLYINDKDLKSKIVELQENIDRLQRKKAKIQTSLENNQGTLNGLKLLDREIKRTSTDARTLSETLSSGLAKAGSVLNGIAKTNPFGRIFRQATGALVSKAVSQVTSTISGGIERFDTLKSAQLNLSAVFADAPNATERVQKAMEKLDKSVQGLPTSLDEIVDSGKQFMTITGDIEKGTNIAIAANRAFLASGADSEQVYHGTKQLYDLLAAGKLRTQEWESLFKAMPIAIQEVGKRIMGSSYDIGKFREQLKSGAIDANTFFDALVAEAGTTEGSLYKLAENSKQLIGSVGTNINIAFKRGYQNILTKLDEVFKKETGRGLIENLLDIRGIVDNAFESIVKVIGNNGPKIVEFFESLKKIDLAPIGRTILDFFNVTTAGIKALVNIISIPVIGRFLSITMMFGSIVGRILTTASELVPIISKLAKLTAVKKLIDRLKKTNISKKFATFGKSLLKGAGKGSDLDKSTKEIPKTLKSLEQVKTEFLRVLMNFGKVAIPAGVTVGLIAGIGGVIKLFQSIGKVNWGSMLVNVGTMGLAVSALSAVITRIGSLMTWDTVLNSLKAGAVVGLVDLLTWVTGLSFGDSMEKFGKGMQTIANGFKSVQNLNKGRIIKGIDNVSLIISKLKEMIYGDHQKGEKISNTDFLQVSKDIETLAGLSENLATIVDSMQTIDKNMGDLNAEKIKQTKDKLNKAITEIYQMFTDLSVDNVSTQTKKTTIKFPIEGPELGKPLPGTIGAKPANAIGTPIEKTTIEKIKVNLSKKVKDIQEIMTMVAEIASSINSVASSINIDTDYNAIIKKIQTAVDGITNIFKDKDYGNAKANAQTFVDISEDTKGAIENMNDAASTASDNGFSKLANSIKTCIDNLDELKKRNNITLNVNVAGNALESLQRIINKLEELRQAKNVDKRVDITQRTILPVNQFTPKDKKWFGGIIRGTYGRDRVPILASAGEYIHNIRAVNTFGTAFMDRINRLDVNGALASLNRRLGYATSSVITNSGYNKTITNNTKNNDITINNNYKAGSNPEFKAGKLLRRL